MPPQIRLGFLLFEERGANSDATSERANRRFVGCYMATNEKGYPLEFRVTTPVRPTTIQRVIYGEQLESYVSNDLVAGTLLTEAEAEPDLLVVNTADLMTLQTDHAFPVIYLAEAAAGVLIEAGDVPPAMVNLGHRELAYRVASNHSERAIRILTAANDSFDALAVFSRMEAALDVLEREDERFR